MSEGAANELAARLPDVDTLVRALDDAGYLADPALGTALFLAARMGQPILLEGEPGVGKTEAAKALATALLRLQCYEGLTRLRRCTSGTTRANCWPSSSRSPGASRCGRPTCSARSTCSPVTVRLKGRMW
jgi:hypothetical protein